MEQTLKTVLDHVPDWTNWDKAESWLVQGLKALPSLTKDSLSESNIRTTKFPDSLIKPPSTHFNLYASETWRKFTLAAFLADLGSYLLPTDQVNFERLLFVMHSFPQGFQVWWVKGADHIWWPAGYSGWYPMLKSAFDVFQKNPAQLKDRMVLPTPSAKGAEPYLYLFNYSVVPNLKKSILSKALMAAYAKDIHGATAKGLAAIAVSEDGSRVAKRFGMSCTGTLTIDGTVENVYTSS